MQIFVLLIALWFMPVCSWANSGGEAADESEGPVTEYIEMKPKFTVNLLEPKKYLMVNVQLLVEGAANVEKIKKHMPALRNTLIMLYSGLGSADVQTMAQREALRTKTKEEISNALNKYAHIDGFRDVFFTEFFVN
jgi:flagellar FliL protein